MAQMVRPDMSENRPASQLVHAVLADVLPNCPAVQLVQTAECEDGAALPG